jgi:hypothetical protein
MNKKESFFKYFFHVDRILKKHSLMSRTKFVLTWKNILSYVHGWMILWMKKWMKFILNVAMEAIPHIEHSPIEPLGIFIQIQPLLKLCIHNLPMIVPLMDVICNKCLLPLPICARDWKLCHLLDSPFGTTIPS